MSIRIEEGVSKKSLYSLEFFLAKVFHLLNGYLINLRTIF